MKWTVINVLGASAWLLGLLFTRGNAFPQWDVIAAGDHRFTLGIAFGLVGLVTLLWFNLRSTT